MRLSLIRKYLSSVGLLLILSLSTLLGGCSAHKRDHFWKSAFESPGYEGFVRDKVVRTKSNPSPEWLTNYYTDLARIGTLADQDAEDRNKAKVQADRNQVINGYLLLADTAYGGDGNLHSQELGGLPKEHRVRKQYGTVPGRVLRRIVQHMAAVDRECVYQQRMGGQRLGIQLRRELHSGEHGRDALVRLLGPQHV